MEMGNQPIIESRNGFENLSTKEITDHHKKNWLCLTVLAPCSHTHAPCSCPMVTLKNLHSQWCAMAQLIIESRNSFENSSSKNSQTTTKNNWHPQSKWQWEQKNWHKTTRKKLPHCRGFMLPSQCSMLIRVPMVNQKSALTAICNGKGWLLSPELVLKIDLQKYWQTITIK